MEKIPVQNERLYFCSPSINVCFRVIIDVMLTKANIEKALETICLKHPFLSSLVEVDNDNNAWLVQKNEPVIAEYYKSDEVAWQEWYKKADNTVFHFSQGPLVKFCVIAGTNTQIIILGHHIIGDGIAYLNVVKDFLLALDNRLAVTVPQIPPFEPADKYFKETVLLDTGVKSFAYSLNEEWRRSRSCFSEEDYHTFFEQYRKKFVPNMYLDSIEDNTLKVLLEKSRENCLTVNEALTSVFALAVMETLNKNEIRLGVAANIRGELVSQPNNCMGNFVTGISSKVYYDTSKDYFSNIKTIAERIREQLSDPKSRHLVVHFLNEFDKDLIESIMYAAYGGYENPVSKKLAQLIGEQLEDKGLGISNLGRHDFNTYHNFKLIDLQFIGPAFPANLVTVGIITVNNKLNVCIRFNEEEIDEDTIRIIFEKVITLWRLN